VYLELKGSLLCFSLSNSFFMSTLARFTAVHSQGSSHGYSRIVRQAYFEDPKCIASDFAGTS
jgi:hypothetical protein